MFSGNGNNRDLENKDNLTLMLLAFSGVLVSRNFYRYLSSNRQVPREVKSPTAVALRGPSPTLFGLATGGATAALSMPRHIVENKYNGRQRVGNEIIRRENLMTVTPSQLPDEGYMYRVRFCHTSTSHALRIIPATLGYVAGVQHCGVLVEGFKVTQGDDGKTIIVGDKPAIMAVYGYNNSTSRGKREIIKNRMVKDLKTLTALEETNPAFQAILKDQLRCAAGLITDGAGHLRGIPGTGFMAEANADFLGDKDPFLAHREDAPTVESLMPLSAVQAGFNETVIYCAETSLNHAHRNCGTAAMFGLHRMYAAADSSSKPALEELHERQKSFAKGVNQGVGVTRNRIVERAATLPSIKLRG